MPRFRITITDPADRAEQLRRALRVRHDLVEQTRVRLDPVHPLPGVHRDEQEHAYLEFASDDLEPVRRIIHAAGHDHYAELSEPSEPLGEACVNCGNIAGPALPPTCPNCGFRDISPCPVCGELNLRSSYKRLADNLFLCPTVKNGIRHRVRLAFNEPMFNPDGTYRQPLVIVLEALPQ